MEVLLVRYGYVLLFLGVALEGEIFLIAASWMARRGMGFTLPLVVLAAIAANFAADQAYYALARIRGRKWLERRFGYHPRYRKAVGLMSRHSGWMLLGSRFAFGFRIIIPAACGAFGMPPVRFAFLNLAAGVLWAVPVALCGFYLGAAAENLIDDFRQYELLVFAVLAAAGTAFLIWKRIRAKRWARDFRWADLHTLAPFMIGLMGLINLSAAIVPLSAAELAKLQVWLPLEVMQHSRPLMLLAGATLVGISRSLARRKETAWFAAVVALSITLVLHLARGLNFQHSLVAGLLLVYLFSCRRRFYARSDPASVKQALWMMPLLTAAVVAYGYVGLSHAHGQYLWPPGADPLSESFRTGILILEPNVAPLTRHAARFLDSLQIAGWLGRLYLLALLLRPVIQRGRLSAPLDLVQSIYRACGRQSLSAFAVQTDKHHLLVAEGRGMVAYATYGSVALTCGDPVLPDADFRAGVAAYMTHCRERGWIPCIYEGTEERRTIYRELGLHTLKVAEEAVLDLGEFGLSGNRRANLRAMVNKVAKTGMTVRPYDRAGEPDAEIDEQLEEISQEWLSGKRLNELGFTIGRFSLEALAGCPVYLAVVGREVEAFCTWLPYRSGEAVVLDLMRKRTNAPAGTMDFLLAQSLLHLKESALVEASLGNAPLANVSGPQSPLEYGVSILFEKLNGFYGYKNLFQFKKKFAPRWAGRYLCYPKGADLPRIAYALAGVHGSGSLLQLALRRSVETLHLHRYPGFGRAKQRARVSG